VVTEKLIERLEDTLSKRKLNLQSLSGMDLMQYYHYVLYCIVSRGSSVDIMSGYGLHDRAIEVRSPAETKGFFL
jgi:hypothetical protein